MHSIFNYINNTIKQHGRSFDISKRKTLKSYFEAILSDEWLLLLTSMFACTINHRVSTNSIYIQYLERLQSSLVVETAKNLTSKRKKVKFSCKKQISKLLK